MTIPNVTEKYKKENYEKVDNNNNNNNNNNVQEIKIWTYKQMVYAQPSTCPTKWHT